MGNKFWTDQGEAHAKQAWQSCVQEGTRPGVEEIQGERPRQVDCRSPACSQGSFHKGVLRYWRQIPRRQGTLCQGEDLLRLDAAFLMALSSWYCMGESQESIKFCPQRQLWLDKAGTLAIVFRKQDVLLTFPLTSQVQGK